MYLNSDLKEILPQNTDFALEKLDLTNCDREPIHIPNLIQPHGVLLALSATEHKILQVSLNTQEILGIEPDKLLNQPLSYLLNKEQLQRFENCLSEDFSCINPLPITIQKEGNNLSFDGIAHRNQDIIILELEPTQANQVNNFFNFYQLVKNPIARIQNTKTLNELCNTIAQEVKNITNFDRVMVYRFDQEGAGSVIAEAAGPDLEPFLGLNYPASDIPRQAKHLYTLNCLRLIPDATYEPIGITPQLNPLTNQLLDLSMSTLRSVSPLHIEYLQNMGVTASMSISLMQNQQLWGLISCHHNTPKQVPYEIRTVCEFIGQIASFELATKEKNQDLDYKIKLKSLQSQLVAKITQAEEFKLALTKNSADLLNLVDATGAIFCFGEEITLVGNTPDITAIKAMLPWLENQFSQNITYQTNSLALAYPPAKAYKEVASGLFALLVSKVPKIFIIWLRPEVIQTVNWGGNPHKPVEIDEEGNLRLSPRKSFAKWQETVELKSLAWKTCEIEAALELRSSIIGIVLRQADELKQLNKELARSNVELDSFAYIASHDLKEPLRGIYNYSSFLLEDYGEILNEEGVDKLNTLMRLTHRMEDLINSLLHYSRLGRAELRLQSVDMNALLADVLDVLKVSARDERVQFIIPRSLPNINCDRTQVNELFTNLISNGIKYNQQTDKTIEIGYLDAEDSVLQEKMAEFVNKSEVPLVFYVRDNGIGIREKHLTTVFRIFKRLHSQNKYGGGTGAGLTIAKKIVERHGGEIWVKSVYGQGSTFYFTLQ